MLKFNIDFLKARFYLCVDLFAKQYFISKCRRESLDS